MKERPDYLDSTLSIEDNHKVITHQNNGKIVVVEGRLDMYFKNGEVNENHCLVAIPKRVYENALNEMKEFKKREISYPYYHVDSFTNVVGKDGKPIRMEVDGESINFLYTELISIDNG